MAGLERRAERRSRSGARALASVQLDALWSDSDLPLRERALWRLLYESAAGVKAVLSLNVEGLDLNDRRARAGHVWVSCRSGTAGLLPVLPAGRTRGPVFLSGQRPGPARTPAQADLYPDTGRRRLSYERVEYLFKQTTEGLDPAADGYTLGQLKPRTGPLPRGRMGGPRWGARTPPLPPESAFASHQLHDH